MTAFAVVSDRVRKIESRTSGARERCSMATNADSSTIASAPKPSVVADVQPALEALTIA